MGLSRRFHLAIVPVSLRAGRMIYPGQDMASVYEPSMTEVVKYSSGRWPEGNQPSPGQALDFRNEKVIDHFAHCFVSKHIFAAAEVLPWFPWTFALHNGVAQY